MAAGNWASPLSNRRAKRMQRLDLRLWLRDFRIDGRVKHALDFSDDLPGNEPEKTSRRGNQHRNFGKSQKRVERIDKVVNHPGTDANEAKPSQMLIEYSRPAQPLRA